MAAWVLLRTRKETTADARLGSCRKAGEGVTDRGRGRRPPASSCSLRRPSTGVGLTQVSPLLSSLASDTNDPQRFTTFPSSAPSAPALPTSGPSFSLHPLFFLHQALHTSQPVTSGFSHPGRMEPLGVSLPHLVAPFLPHDPRASSPGPVSLLSSRSSCPACQPSGCLPRTESRLHLCSSALAAPWAQLPLWL